MSFASSGGAPLYDPTAPLVASGNLARRERVSRVIDALAIGSSGAAVIVLAIVAGFVFFKGIGAISWTFLTKDPTILGTGGEASAIVGTISIVVVAAIIATPFGVLTAIFLTEFVGRESRAGRTLTRLLNLMQSLPTIVVGIFIFSLLVDGTGQSGIAASIALAIVMLPLIARSSQEVLLRVPNTLREAGDALGIDRYRTILTVVLPTAMGGIVTGTILAVARAAGETAPLLLCDSLFANGTSVNVFHPVANIPITIFTLSDNPDPTQVQKAWGLALVLLTVILVANIGARVLLARSRKRMGL